MYVNIKKKSIIIWSFCLLILVIIIAFLYIKIDNVKFGKKIILDSNVLNISSFYAEYDATVISNKNINTYFVKEWYKEGVGGKIEYLDYMGNIVSIISTPSYIYINNSNNKANISTNNIYIEDNVLSLSTYINVFNKNITCACSKNIYEKDGEINIIYDVCNKEDCMQSSSIKHMDVDLFELNIKANIPITYTVYTGNKKEYACIVYNKFEVNTLIDDNIFSISK